MFCVYLLLTLPPGFRGTLVFGPGAFFLLVYFITAVCLSHLSSPPGGHVRVVMDLELESALQKVLSSAFSMRGSVFISYDNQHSMFEAPGKPEKCSFFLRRLFYCCCCCGYFRASSLQ